MPNPDHRTAVHEADAIYRRRDTLTPITRDEAIAVLVSHGIWSRRNIEAITGASRWFVAQGFSKSNKRGGRLNPESLATISQIIRLKDKGEIDRGLYAQVIVEERTSVYTVAKLVGEPVTTVKRWAGQIEGRVAA